MRLLRRREHAFNLPLSFRIAPGAEQVLNRIKLQNVLELQSVLVLQKAAQRQVKDRMHRALAAECRR